MRVVAILVVALYVAMLRVSPADDTQTADALVKQLGDSKYSVRKEAAAGLRAMGQKAVEALERAAKSDDPEVSLAAAEILKDARLGIEPDWPAGLADSVRGCDKLDRNARVALIRRAAAELRERVVPFFICRLAAGDATESSCINECLRSSGNKAMAECIIAKMRESRNAGEARTLGWAYVTMDRPLDALRVLTAQRANEQAVREISEQTVKNILVTLEQKNFKAAEEAAGEFAKAAPSEARFLYLQAQALRELGKAKEADALQAKALGLNPDQEAPHYVAGEMLMDLGLDEPSCREWELILKIPPADDVYDINAYLRLGRIYDHLQRHDVAADNLEKALNVYKAKRAGGRAGYGLMGASEADLARKVAALREKAGKGRLVAGDKGEQVRLRVQTLVKDGKLAELKKALSSAAGSMAMNVAPLGLRLLDLDQCSIVYNREKEEVSVLLNGTPACTPQKVSGGNNQDKLTAAMYNLDCVYIIEVDTLSGVIRKTARFEKDYSVRVELDEGIRNYRSAPVKIGDREYRWDDLLKGTVIDYLPPALDLHLEGKQPDGTPRTLDFRIPIEEGSLEMTDEGKKDAAADR